MQAITKTWGKDGVLDVRRQQSEKTCLLTVGVKSWLNMVSKDDLMRISLMLCMILAK
jgi:hypothetical protein